MKKLSPQTKSFVILLVIALVGTYVCLMLWAELIYQKGGPQGDYDYGSYKVITYTQNQQNTPTTPTPVPVNTSTWKSYSNSQYNFSFLYNPSWKVLAAKKLGDYELIQIDPGAKYYDINVYVSPVGFYIMGGLPTTSETIGGQPALNVRNALYGITANNLYYTFDVGWSMSLVPQFDALVHSVTFQN